MYERLGLGITLDFQDNASAKIRNIAGQFENLINVSGRMVKGFDSGIASLHFEGLTVAGFALERLATRMDYYGTKIIKGFVGMGKAVVDAGAKMETYRNIFEVFYKDANVAKQKMQWAMDFAASTPFEMGDMLDTLKSMKAIGVDVDKEVETLSGKKIQLMEVLGDLAVLAPPTQGIKGMMIGIRNLYGGMERSFQQRMDIKPSQIIGHAVGKTTEEITKSLVELRDKLAPEMMQKLFGTWTQTVSNFADQYQRMLFALNNAGAFDASKKSLINLYSIIKDIQGAELQKLGQNLSDVFRFLWKPVDALSRVVGRLILGFKNLSENYPFIMKLISGVALASGVFLVGAGFILKWCGMIIMAVAAIATFYVNVIIFRLQSELMNTALLRSIKYIGLFVKAFILSGILMGLAIYSYEKNLFGFRDTVNGVLNEITVAWRTAWDALYGAGNRTFSHLQSLEGLSKIFAKMMMFGTIIKALFTQKTDKGVFFFDRQRMNLEALGMWDFAKLLVMIKGRVDAFVKGFVEGFKLVSDVLKTFFNTILAPFKALFKGIDGLITRLTGKKSMFGIMLGEGSDVPAYEKLGSSLGKILALLVGFKVVKSLGNVIVSPFRLLSSVLTQVGEKIKWSGGLLNRAFGSKNPFYYYEGKRSVAGDKSKSIADMMNATSDDPVKIRYSRNPILRMMQQRQMYRAATDLKTMELAESLGTRKGGIVGSKTLTASDMAKIANYTARLSPDTGKKLSEMLASNSVYADPTQGALSRILMGRRNLLFGADGKEIDVNGQKVKVPDIKQFMQGGLLSGFFNRFGGGGYNATYTSDDALFRGNLGMDKSYHSNIVKNSLKNVAKGTLLRGVNAFGTHIGMLSGFDKVKADRLRRTIATMEANGNTRQIGGMRSQLANLYTNTQYNVLDDIADARMWMSGKRDDVTGFVSGKYAGAKNYVAQSRLGRGASWIGDRAGMISDSIYGRTGINLRNLPSEAAKSLPKGAWNLTKGAGRGLLGAGGMALRGAGVLGGGLLAAAPWLAAAGAVGGAIYGKLSGGKQGKEGLEQAQATVKSLTEEMRKNGPQSARNFFEAFKTQGKETWGLLKDLAIESFRALAGSGIFADMWNGLKMGAQLAWEWIQTSGVTYVGKLFNWILTDGLAMLFKGLGKLFVWGATDLVPGLIKIITGLALTLGKVLYEAVSGGIRAAINLVGGMLPVWVVKMFGGKSTITSVDLPGDGRAGGGGQFGIGGVPLSDKGGFISSRRGDGSYHHGGLWLSKDEHPAVIRKDETVLPPNISRKLSKSLNGNGGKGDIIVQKMEVTVIADKLSVEEARQQALLILREFKKLKAEDMLRKGDSSLVFV